MQDEIIEETGEVVEQQAPQQQPTERTFTSREMTEVVKRERERAYEKAKREAQQTASQVGNEFGMSPEEIRRMAQEEALKSMRDQQQQAQLQQVVGSFVNKIEASSERYPNLKEQLREIDFESFAPVVALATDLENTADIVAHLVSDPMKMSGLLTLLERQPKVAAKAIYDLSQSLKNNEQALAKNLDKASAPFDKLERTGGTAQSEDSLSVSDFRKLYR